MPADEPLDFEVAVGGLLLFMKRQDDALFQKLLHKTRAEVMGVLSAASMDSYQRAYSHMIKLHMLHGMHFPSSGCYKNFSNVFLCRTGKKLQYGHYRRGQQEYNGCVGYTLTMYATIIQNARTHSQPTKVRTKFRLRSYTKMQHLYLRNSGLYLSFMKCQKR